MRSSWFLVTLVWALGGCASDGTDEDGPGETQGPGSGPPVVESLVSDVDIIDDQSGVVFTATVTDPNGADDIVGGVMSISGGGPELGAFDDNGDGTWRFVTGWTAINQVEPLDTGTIELTATFTDQSDQTGSGDASLITCADDLRNCSGVCTDINKNVQHCGACDDPCAENLVCVDGLCDAGN